MQRETNSIRENYMDREDFFMAIAFLASQRSKDPITQVGACIVNEHGVVVSVGHNQMPKDSDDFPWARNSTEIKGNKYPYVCHAGLTAILNKNSADVRGCTMYVTLFPSSETAKIISQAGIKEVVYLSDKYESYEDTEIAKYIFKMTGVMCRHFVPKCQDKIVIDFPEIISNIMC
uniref:Probable deoxycytidylate deaminase n=1 Tax=Anoplophora glabripennis TaxID=217634 RepID=V5GYL8_ANOGL